MRAVIGRETERDYVIRPWTEAENADFERFCDSIGKMPDDPAHAEAMRDGDVREVCQDFDGDVKVFELKLTEFSRTPYLNLNENER